MRARQLVFCSFLHIVIIRGGSQRESELIVGWGGGCVFALLTQTGTVQRLWAAHRPLVCALILDTHGKLGLCRASIAAVIQLPGRATHAASQAHNNPTVGWKIQAFFFFFLLRCQQSVSLGRMLCSWWAPAPPRPRPHPSLSGFHSRQHKVIFREALFLLSRKPFGISRWGRFEGMLHGSLKSTSDLNMGHT